MMGRELDGRLAVVTGGRRGIGRAIADALAKAGADVHVSMSEANGDGAPLPHPLHVVDVVDAAAVATALCSLPAPVTLVVNNARITRDGSLVKMSDAEWGQVLSINLRGAFNVIRAAVLAMIAAGSSGRVVNVTSTNGIRGKFGQAD